MRHIQAFIGGMGQIFDFTGKITQKRVKARFYETPPFQKDRQAISNYFKVAVNNVEKK